MDINKITSFCTVVDEGSMSKAAEKLFCSQPALTKQIKALEQECGYQLFSRSGKKLVLNKSGELFYQFGKRLEKDLSQLKSDLYALNHTRKNIICFGATNYAGIYLMPQIISEFKRNYAHIAVSFTMDFLPNVISLLELDKIDFAIVPESMQILHNSDYNCKPLCKDDMLLVLPVNHPLAQQETVSPQEIMPFVFLVSQVKSATREYVLAQLGSIQCVPDNIIDMYNTEAIKRSVISGMGISILSRLSVMEEERNGLLVTKPIAGLPLQRSLYCMYKKLRQLSPDTQLFIDTIYGCVKEN